MPRGARDKYTDKQKRKAEHIEEGYEERGVNPVEAERRAWATVNKQDGGGLEGGRLARDAGDGGGEDTARSPKSGTPRGRGGSHSRAAPAGTGRTRTAAKTARRKTTGSRKTGSGRTSTRTGTRARGSSGARRAGGSRRKSASRR